MGAPARRLRIGLRRFRACNAVLVKLVRQENLMHIIEDDHAAPNIDVGYVTFNGSRILLPDGLALSC